MEEMAAAAMRLASSGPTVLSHRLMKHFAAATNKYPRDGGACRGAGNLVFSPLSIYSSLSVMAAGARGRTLSELLRIVGARGREGGGLDEDARGTARHALSGCSQLGGPQVFNACGVCHEATRTPKLAYAYRNTATVWGGVARAIDFTKPEEAGKQINSWVADWTDNLIDSILDPAVLADDTRLMLANAVYFKGRLERSFHVKCRSMERRPFHRLDGSAVDDAEFISSDEDQFIATHDGFKVLRMTYTLRDPFRGLPAKTMAALLCSRNFSLPRFPQHSLYIVLPDAHDGLWSLHDKMAASVPGFLDQHLPEWPVRVGELRVPRLRISFSTSVKHALQDLGIQTLFSTGADLPDMLEHDDGPHEPLFLSDVLHRAVLEVDEEGLLPTVPRTKNEPGSVDFVADHPFAFFVVEEESGGILLAGHVLDPTQQG